MSHPVIDVETATDVREAASELTSRDAETILALLEHDLDEPAGPGGEDELVFWLPDWLVEEKNLDSVEGSDRVFTAWLVRETDKAWGVSQLKADDRGEHVDLVFLPKSVSRVFRRGRVDSISNPQSGLDTFARDAT